jgi:selenocysteine lyase/cysteine desulfurase
MSLGAAPGDDLIHEQYPDKVLGYFDSASIGLVPSAVGAAVADCYVALGLGVRGSGHWRAVVEQSAGGLAEEFGAADDEISFMASTGEAFNAIARAVAWRDGDEVLVLDDDFPTVVLPWTRLGDRVRVVRASPLAGDDRLGALTEAITPRTRVVAVSHVNSTTGTRLDLDVLGAECRRAGALLVCDGAQAAGCIPVDVRPVDFYVATGYKWLLAGFGIAMVIAKRDSVASLHPTLLGHGNLTPETRLPYGHLNVPGVYALNAASTVRRRFGLEAIHSRIAELVHQVHVEATGLGLQPVAPLERSGPIVSLSAVGDVEAAVGLLFDAGISVAARGGCLRISPNFCTTDREVDDLLAALGRLAARR